MKDIKKEISVKLFPVKPPLYADRYLNKFLWRVESSDKIYLTFDDGPTPEITIKVLDILDKYNIKSTFFCLGRNVDKYKSIYNEIIKRGHGVGNHSYSHLNGWKTKLDEYLNDVSLATENIKTNLFRPPYGKIRPRQLKAVSEKYKVVMWDVLSGDYSPRINKDTCYNNVVKTAKEGSIIVFHDSIKASENLFYALPKSIEYFLKKGFKFDVL